jgi:hypothetical protein
VLRGAIDLTASAPAPEILVEGVIKASSALGPVELTILPGVAETTEFNVQSPVIRRCRLKHRSLKSNSIFLMAFLSRWIYSTGGKNEGSIQAQAFSSNKP